MKDHVLFQGSFEQACLLLGNFFHVCNVANGLLCHIVYIKVKLLYCWNQVYSNKKRKFQFLKRKHFILFCKYGMTNYCSNICMYDSN